MLMNIFQANAEKLERLKANVDRALESRNECARLRQVILARVCGRPVREMRSYARLAPRIRTDEFETELRAIAAQSNCHAVRNAELILEYLRQARFARGYKV
jgi:hypothetical protein